MVETEMNRRQLEKKSPHVNQSFDWRRKHDDLIRENNDFAVLHYTAKFIRLMSQCIREKREETGLTQSQLAERAGIKQSQLSRLERFGERFSILEDSNSVSDNDLAEMMKIDGPTIGLVAKALAGAGFKVDSINVVKCRVERFD